jgi:hypothetical protein
VSGALPGETVIAERCFSRAKFEEAQVSEDTSHLSILAIQPDFFSRKPTNTLSFLATKRTPRRALRL